MYEGEKFNSITHLAGSVMAAAGLVVLVVKASSQGGPREIVSFSIYGATLFLLYTFSTLYHSLRGRSKKVFRKLDHFSIYLLIAGSYTPVTLVTLQGGWGWSLFGVVWGLAILGIALESAPIKGRRILPVLLYLAMGWLVLIALPPLIEAMPQAGLILLAAGGLFYTVGIIFYLLGGRLNHAHGIWHLFVLAGSVSHYLVVFLYIA